MVYKVHVYFTILRLHFVCLIGNHYTDLRADLANIIRVICLTKRQQEDTSLLGKTVVILVEKSVTSPIIDTTMMQYW